MFDNTLRKLKDRMFEPVARLFLNINPKALTLAGFIFGLFSAYFAFTGLTLFALAMWLFNRGLDGLDGAVARLHEKQDDLGGYLDIMADTVIYALLPFSLVAGLNSTSAYLALAVMLAMFYINTASWMFLAAILEKRALRNTGTQTTIIMPSGLVAGFETILFYSAFLLFPAQVVTLFIIFSILVLITVLQRFIWAGLKLRQPIAKGIQNEIEYISPPIHAEQYAKRTHLAQRDYQ